MYTQRQICLLPSPWAKKNCEDIGQERMVKVGMAWTRAKLLYGTAEDGEEA